MYVYILYNWHPRGPAYLERPDLRAAPKPFFLCSTERLGAIWCRTKKCIGNQPLPKTIQIQKVRPAGASRVDFDS